MKKKTWRAGEKKDCGTEYGNERANCRTGLVCTSHLWFMDIKEKVETCRSETWIEMEVKVKVLPRENLRLEAEEIIIERAYRIKKKE